MATASCTWNAAGSTACTPATAAVALPTGLEESSGAAPSAHRPGVVWTHNDSGDDPRLVAVDGEGRTAAALRPAGARRVDWEALERTDCPEGSCLWIADTGDNLERRSDPVLYRLVEPVPSDDPGQEPPAAGGPEDGAPGPPTITVDAQAYPVRFPDGPRDVEALFVLPGEDLHLITKGRSDPVTLYRYPPPLRPGEAVTLEAVQTLTGGPARLPEQVTGAAASADGRRVVVRTYQTLTFYRVAEGSGGSDAGGGGGSFLVPLPGGSMDLTSLREAQGEGVAWLSGARLALTSEAGPGGRRGGLRVLRCEGPGGP